MLRRLVPACGVLLLAVLATGCASTGGVPRPRPFPSPGGGPPDTPATPPPAVAPPPAPQGERDRSALIETALSLRGIPYRNGGSDPMGFDCSGFTQYVFAKFGLFLPRGVREQFASGMKVSLDSLQPGDLLFFSTTTKGASHVGIAVGNSQFVHAPSSRGVIRVESFMSPYWQRRFIGARRVS